MFPNYQKLYIPTIRNKDANFAPGPAQDEALVVRLSEAVAQSGSRDVTVTKRLRAKRLGVAPREHLARVAENLDSQESLVVKEGRTRSKHSKLWRCCGAMSSDARQISGENVDPEQNDSLRNSRISLE